MNRIQTLICSLAAVASVTGAQRADLVEWMVNPPTNLYAMQVTVRYYPRPDGIIDSHGDRTAFWHAYVRYAGTNYAFVMATSQPYEGAKVDAKIFRSLMAACGEKRVGYNITAGQGIGGTEVELGQGTNNVELFKGLDLANRIELTRCARWGLPLVPGPIRRDGDVLMYTNAFWPPVRVTVHILRGAYGELEEAVCQQHNLLNNDKRTTRRIRYEYGEGPYPVRYTCTREQSGREPDVEWEVQVRNITFAENPMQPSDFDYAALLPPIRTRNVADDTGLWYEQDGKRTKMQNIFAKPKIQTARNLFWAISIGLFAIAVLAATFALGAKWHLRAIEKRDAMHGG